MSALEIIYNIISFIIAAVMTIGFTFYSKKSLNELQSEEKVNMLNFEYGNVQMENLPLDRPNDLSLHSSLQSP